MSALGQLRGPIKLTVQETARLIAARSPEEHTRVLAEIDARVGRTEGCGCASPHDDAPHDNSRDAERIASDELRGRMRDEWRAPSPSAEPTPTTAPATEREASDQLRQRVRDAWRPEPQE